MRQFGCIEVSQLDALVLRDVIRPLSKVDPYDPALTIALCEKLYAALLKVKAHRLETINIPLEEHEALFINQFVGNEDWAGALALLEQSWLVLHELRHKAPYQRPTEDVAAVLDRITTYTPESASRPVTMRPDPPAV